MGLDDLTPDDSGEPETYQAGVEYPVEFTGHYVTPVFEIRPSVPDQYIKRYGGHKEAMEQWIENERPLMWPAQFKEFFREQSKSVFSGEEQLRPQAVIKGTAVHDEWKKDRDEVELGFRYITTVYYNDTHYEDGDERYRRAESMMENDLMRWVGQFDEIFNSTPYEVVRYSLVPHPAGESPLNPEYERY